VQVSGRENAKISGREGPYCSRDIRKALVISASLWKLK
jgi:hypothetical protein